MCTRPKGESNLTLNEKETILIEELYELHSTERIEVENELADIIRESIISKFISRKR